MAAWDVTTINKLIDLWAEERIQDMLESSYRNSDVYKEIAETMNENREVGSQFTWQQCRNKIKTLRADYRKAKRYQKLSGSGRTKFTYFDKMDSVLGHRPSTTPLHMIDTSIDSIDVNLSSESEGEQSKIDDNNCEDNSSVSSVSSTGENQDTGPDDMPKLVHKPRTKRGSLKNVTSVENQNEAEGETSNNTVGMTSRTSEASGNGETLPSESSQGSSESRGTKRSVSGGFQIRKRKNKNSSITETLEAFIKLEDKTAQRQMESDEKVMKMQMEFEQKMRRLEMEKEDSRRREERQFQMQMMQMQMHMFNSIPSQSPYSTDSSYENNYSGTPYNDYSNVSYGNYQFESNNYGENENSSYPSKTYTKL